MLPHSFLFGHLLQAQSLGSRLPPDGHITNLLSDIAEKYSDTDGIYYMDTWPFSSPLMVVSSPSAAAQVIQQLPLLKPAELTKIFYPITGGPDIIFMNGEQWRKSRQVFNPGFAPGYLLRQVPAIVEEVVIFQNALREHSKSCRIVQLDPITLDLTLDVIVRITL